MSFQLSLMLCFALGRQHNSLAVAATVIALIDTGDGILGSLSEPMIGKFLDLGWNHQFQNGVRYFSVADYRWAFIPLLGYLLLALFLVYFIRETPKHRALSEAEVRSQRLLI